MSEIATIYLDFDGVLAHSAIECIDTAMAVFKELVEFGVQDIGSEQHITEIKKVAVNNRHLVLPPENYYCLLKAARKCVLQNKINYTSVKECFELEVKNIDPKFLVRFKTLFFAVREQSANKLTNQDWYLQNPATPFVHQLTSLLKNDNILLEIVSRKDNASLLRWVDGSPFEFDGIHGNETLALENNEKYALICKLQERRGNRSAIFVDDALDELAGFDWKSIGVTPIAAGWGYNSLDNNLKEALEYIKGWVFDLYH